MVGFTKPFPLIVTVFPAVDPVLGVISSIIWALTIEIVLVYPSSV